MDVLQISPPRLPDVCDKYVRVRVIAAWYPPNSGVGKYEFTKSFFFAAGFILEDLLTIYLLRYCPIVGPLDLCYA